MRLKKKKSVPTEQTQKKAAQDWLPFQDVTSSFIWRKDDNLVAVLRVEPMNITLKSESEKKQIITALHEALNGQMEHILIFCLPRPVDLDNYLERLQQMARESVDATRKRLLTEYLHYVATVVHRGEATELRFYILISQPNSNHAKDELTLRAFEIAGNISQSGLKVSICEDTDILDMLFSFLNPSQAAFEATPLGSPITTLYKEV